MITGILSKYESLLSLVTVANLATIDSNGNPHLTPVWFDVDQETILINTAVGRRKDRNMKQNPNVALTILDPQNPYSYVGIIGQVIDGTLEGADAHIDKLAHKYSRGRLDKYPSRTATETRILYRIKPLKGYGFISKKNPFEQ